MFEDSLSDPEELQYSSTSYVPSGSESSVDECSTKKRPKLSESTDEPATLATSTKVTEVNEVTAANEVTTVNEQVVGRHRIKNEMKWKRNVRKHLRNSGQSYVNVSGKSVAGKAFEAFQCLCPLKCDTKFEKNHREKLFESFYGLGDFNLQTAHLCGLITVRPKQRSYGEDTSKRENTRVYNIPNPEGYHVVVCKTFFKKSFSVSDGRISRALKGMSSQLTPPTDKRGKKSCLKKITDEQHANVVKFISQFPSYESHYSRKKAPDRKYLAPDLNITILYDLYKEKTIAPVSPFLFRRIFNREFNLSFHPPLVDTCKKCDAFNIQIKAAKDGDRKKIEFEKERHLRKADLARSEMKEDSEVGKINNSHVTVISFDLMKTLPTPVISTGVAYYKRQLWTYCLGVHNLSSNDSYMYVWDESQASRGPQEIASCLLHFIKTFVKTKKLIMYSDQCGGQNRNFKMVAFCMHVVCSEGFIVEEIDHKFLVSGHSYMACDEDFGLIEKQKKYYKNIFLPASWQELIKNARKKPSPFKVIQMTTNDFKSSKQLEFTLTNRKLQSDKNKVQWLKMQWINVTKTSPGVMYYKYTNSREMPSYSVDHTKRRTKLYCGDLNLLYPTGRNIDILKYKDLQDLMMYIPPVYHVFYNALKTNSSATDTGCVVTDDSSEAE